MSTKYAAKGAVIKAGATATPTTVVPGLKSVGMPGGDREMIDVTNHGSVATKESIPEPLRDIRQLEVTLFYDPADAEHERLRAAQAAGTLEYQTLTLPDTGAAQWAFSGYITSFSLPELGVSGALECTYTFTAVGAETFTA